MRRTVSLFVAVFMILTLVGCSKYHSKYKAVGFVHSNDLSSAYMNFYTFEGRMVFKLKSITIILELNPNCFLSAAARSLLPTEDTSIPTRFTSSLRRKENAVMAFFNSIWIDQLLA